MSEQRQSKRKIYFGNATCQECGRRYDPTLQECPSCGAKNPDKRAASFKNFMHVHPLKEAGLFAIGLIGLSIIATLVQIIVLLIAKPSDSMTYASSGECLFWTYAFAYPLLLLAMGLLLWKDWGNMLPSFKNWKAYVAGFIGFALLIVFSIGYNLIINAIFKAAGVTLPEENSNQSNVVSMVLYGPAVCFFVIGLIGPLAEELAYRVGLFGLASRLGKWAGYLASILVFAFIHFDFTSIGTEAVISELVSLPNYLVSGAVLCFLYDKFGICGSFVGHALNNLQSVALIIIEKK